ncbi:hypothetical protein T07_8829 [Trichinella nelsoni]|uniref:Uncharacterized protein n=1 Tax=Trichinella nelsoni TaxID=6336 RepID=A0A0V0RXB5_9BILA|nr:hypothetical protein T07_8829 [Trichinella nelsoni]
MNENDSTISPALFRRAVRKGCGSEQLCVPVVVQYGPRLAQTGRFVSPLLLDWLFVCLQLPVKSGFCVSETGHKIHSSPI